MNTKRRFWNNGFQDRRFLMTDTAEKGGYAVSFYIVRSLDLPKKARAPDQDFLLYDANYVGI